MYIKTILALDIGGTKIKSALVQKGKLINNFRTDDSNADLGKEALLMAVKEVVGHYSNYDCIAAASAGQINPEKGLVTFATDNIKNYTGTDLEKFFLDNFGVPSVIENDVKAVAIGEKAYGAAKGDKNFLCLTYGTGIGGCAVVDNKIIYGNNFAAGEFGHIITHARGVQCTCGGHGCYEQYASANALTRYAQSQNSKYHLGSQFAEHLDDAGEYEIINHWIEEVTFGLISLIYNYNPEKIVLGGAVMENKKIVSLIVDKLQSILMPNYKHVEVVGAELSNAAGLLGVSKMAEDNF